VAPILLFFENQKSGTKKLCIFLTVGWARTLHTLYVYATVYATASLIYQRLFNWSLYRRQHATVQHQHTATDGKIHSLISSRIL